MTNPPPRRVLLAPDKFKGSLTAAQVAAALAAGITRAAPGTTVHRTPVADGGDGTVDAFVAAGWERVEIESYGPTLAPVTTSYAVRVTTAVVELAAVSGITKMPGGQPDPLHSSTYGVGDVIGDALDRGARNIVIGLGGSASTDGGAGMLQALGLRILDAEGNELPCGGAALARAVRVDRTDLHPGLADATVVLASDVDNPLLGPNGAAAVYGPQKGADSEQLATLEAALKNWAAVLGPEWDDKPGAGAAGGTGFGALAALGARMRSGIELVLDLIDFRAQLADADLVITGEGSLDEQSLSGKAPLGVLDAARAAGVPVIAVAGRIALTPEQVRAAGFAGAYALSDLEPAPARSMADAAALLERIGARIAEN
ncbi:glycerate kinase [Nocardia seriolae]|uniref:glycerate kinase n=1 Tax=Nocardia seriolae TaxID=37332 RepID=UPI00090AEE32|nr:glycerate kinase [Nocardia seriolae]MTJ66819.1 glycerate kinase [Nocardia seriolae]MTJ70382.1 glycerate kinase [Nocardia seriolae]MTJ85345.1 glycerate kinase [Nocardia seriolae]MTK29341.1 glycerate kinase [Nocardia seriolae]MTK44752.1 glycerate kinase [Nocardia seriolae]